MEDMKQLFKDKYLNKQKDLSAKSVYPPFPRILKIDTCNTCNYNCVFCPQSKQYNKVGNIDKELCYKIIDDAYAAGARELCLSMTGEPLLNKELSRYVSYAKKLGYEYIFFNTNGYLLTEDLSNDLLVAGVDSIKVSFNAGRKSYALIHGVDAYDRIVNNIKNFDRLRKEKGHCAFYISFVAVRQTIHEAEEVKTDLGEYVDEIIVMNANGRGGSVFDHTSKLYIADDEYTFQYPCSQLFNNVYVTAEGYMIICCQDFENLTVVADLHHESVVNAWTNEKFTRFREKYLNHDLEGTLCKNCISNLQEEVIPLTPEKAYYDLSLQKENNLIKRIDKLVGNVEYDYDKHACCRCRWNANGWTNSYFPVRRSIQIL